jgi:hypothetical protein
MPGIFTVILSVPVDNLSPVVPANMGSRGNPRRLRRALM